MIAYVQECDGQCQYDHSNRPFTANVTGGASPGKCGIILRGLTAAGFSSVFVAAQEHA
jgi:hypothetical protein